MSESLNARPRTIRLHHRWAALATAAAALCAGAGAAHAATTYSVRSVAGATGLQTATTLGPQGQVYGKYYDAVSGTTKMAMWDPATGATIDLTSDATFTDVWLEQGNGVGQFGGRTGSNPGTPFVRNTDGTRVPFTTPDAAATSLGAPVVGEAGTLGLTGGISDGTCVQAKLWMQPPGGQWNAIVNPSGGNGFRAADVNRAGQLAGSILTTTTCPASPSTVAMAPYQPWHASITTTTGVKDIHVATATGVFSNARSINDAGIAVGEFDTGLRTAATPTYQLGMPITHAVIWDTVTGTTKDVGTTGMLSTLRAVNSSGVFIGTNVGPATSGGSATFTKGGPVVGTVANPTLVDVNALLDTTSRNAGWSVFAVSAVNDAGQILGQAYDGSQLSNIVVLTPTTTTVTAVPTAPTNLVATAPSSRRVHLTWTDTATNETGYTVERCKGSTCTAFAKVASLGANAVAFDDTSVRSGTTYRYRVLAVNAAGRSASGSVSIVAR